jgi:hypothetical protein
VREEKALGCSGERVELDESVRDAVDGDAFEVGGHVDWFGELLLDEGREGLHLGLVAVDEHDILGVDVAQEVDDALGVGVGREGDVDHLHLDLVELLVQGHFLGASQQPVAQRALHAIAGNDQGIALVGAPLLEDLHAGAAVQHSRSGEEHVGHVGLEEGLVEGTHLLELEHVVPVGELLLDLLVLPVHEQPVEEVGPFDQASREVDGHAAIGAFPVAFQQH